MKLSRRALMASTFALTCAATLRPGFALAGMADGKVGFTDSNAAQLAGIKRVVIANCVVEFQTSHAMNKDGGNYINKNDTKAKMALTGYDPATMQNMAEIAYKNLKEHPTAQGFEPESTGKAILGAILQSASNRGLQKFYWDASINDTPLFQAATGQALIDVNQAFLAQIPHV